MVPGAQPHAVLQAEHWGPFDLVYGSTPPLGHASPRSPGKRRLEEGAMGTTMAHLPSPPQGTHLQLTNGYGSEGVPPS